MDTKEEMFLAEMGIYPQTIIEGDYTAKYKLKDLLKTYAKQLSISDVIEQSEQLVCDCSNENWVYDESGVDMYCKNCEPK